VPSLTHSNPPASSAVTRSASHPERLTEEIIQLALRSGCAGVGVTSADVFEETRTALKERKARELHGGMAFTYRNPERSTDPRRIIEGARSLVVGAWDYRRLEGPAPGRSPNDGTGIDGEGASTAPVIARVAEYARHDYYRDLRVALTGVAERLHLEGWRARVVCDDNALVDRAAAHRAGLGWFGKNSLLLLPGLGSRVVLGAVVTDAGLVATPATPSAHGQGCGTCRRCQTACPTGALDEPGVVDARRCLAWLLQAPGSFPTEYRQALGDRIYGCDECQTACPINRVVDRRSPRPSSEAAPDGGTGVDVLGILRASDAELLAQFGRWYIARRDPRYLRRNALVVLGNVGDGRDPETVAALSRWITADDDLLAEHARWAAGRLGRDDLVTAPR
jgi:epoxyqueuosine reductase